jgi:hypothetical protein
MIFIISDKYKYVLTNDILLNYSFIKYLDINNNTNVTNVNHLNKLIKLNASGKSGIYDFGIKYLNLTILNISSNKK